MTAQTGTGGALISSAWAHWKYDQEEWERFIELDSQRTSRSRVRWLSFTVLFSLVIGVFAAFVVSNASIWAALGVGILLAALAFAWLTGFGSAWFVRSKNKWYTRLKTQAREIVIKPMNIEIAGTAIPLMSRGASLTRAWVGYGDPPRNSVTVLKFRLEEWGSRRGPYEVWVPVPPGKESEGRALAEQFQREFVKPARRPLR
jgi:hypothetical protein